MKKRNKEKTKYKALLILLVICIAAAAGIAIYINDFYPAEAEAIQCLSQPEEEVQITRHGENYIFAPKDPTTGIIFYPGGKVEATSYAPLLLNLAKQGILTVLVPMPANLAILGTDLADGIAENFPEMENWYLAGHSLGGTAAAIYLEENAADYEGLILLASYANVNLSGTDLDVLSIYGDQDQVLNLEAYQENQGNLPQDYREVILEGGCHSYFGAYGMQDGDGQPTISPETQMEQTVEAICGFLEETGSPESDRNTDSRPEYTPQETYDDSFFGKPAQQLYEEVFSVTDQKTEYVHYYVTNGTLYLDEYAETGEQDEEGLFLYEWNRGKWIADNVIAVDYNWYRMQPDALYITSDHVLHGTGKYSGITLENVRYASVYADQMLALTLDGSLWCRGKLYSIATGHTLEYQGWELVMEDVAYAQLAHYRYMAITGDGSLYMWGDNAYGQFGDGSLLTDGSGSDLEAAFYSEPVKVADGIKMVWEGYPGRPKQTEEIGECRTYFLTEQDELFVCGQGIGDETRSFSYFGELGTLKEPLQVLCTNQLHRVK